MTEMKTADICQAAGMQVMDKLNDVVAGAHSKPPVAVMGHNLDDGSYEFLLGPVYLPHDQVSLAPPTETRAMFVNLRLDDMPIVKADQVKWMCKRGDDYVEDEQPTRAIVIDGIQIDPDKGHVSVCYHNSRA